MPKAWRDTVEAANYLTGRGCKTKPTTLRKMRCVGGGPEFSYYGRKPVYSEECLNRFIDDRVRASYRSTSGLRRSRAEDAPITETQKPLEAAIRETHEQMGAAR